MVAGVVLAGLSGADAGVEEDVDVAGALVVGASLGALVGGGAATTADGTDVAALEFVGVESIHRVARKTLGITATNAAARRKGLAFWGLVDETAWAVTEAVGITTPVWLVEPAAGRPTSAVTDLEDKGMVAWRSEGSCPSEVRSTFMIRAIRSMYMRARAGANGANASASSATLV